VTSLATTGPCMVRKPGRATRAGALGSLPGDRGPGTRLPNVAGVAAAGPLMLPARRAMT
jgi:hypothetical protein